MTFSNSRQKYNNVDSSINACKIHIFNDILILKVFSLVTLSNSQQNYNNVYLLKNMLKYNPFNGI